MPHPSLEPEPAAIGATAAEVTPPERTSTPGWDEIADAATRSALEWPAFLAVLAELAATDVGARALLEARPLPDRASHELRQQLLTEVELVLVEGTLVPSSEEALEPLALALHSRRELEGRALVVLAAALASVESIRQRVAALPHLPLLSARFEWLPPLDALLRRTAAVLDERGEVRDDASVALVRLREQVRRQRDSVYAVLRDEMVRHRDQLADDTFPVRDGRVVLVVQSSGRPQVDGLVHGRSGTGRSVYLEPLVAVEPNNALRQASDEEQAERRRLVRELLDLWHEHGAAVAAGLALLGELDTLQALARFSELCDARVAALAETGELRLLDARHPLLEPRLEELRLAALGNLGHRGAVVGLDLDLPVTLRALAITGANAGGKTVSLKTVGLAVLATRAGLPFPLARGSSVVWVERLIAAIGDDQDVLHERSTFSGRLERIRQALAAAAAGTLVLLDELGSGTDPEEGGALAAAIVERLLDDGARVLLTTHLAPLAAHLAELEGASTAAMDFDPEHGTPRFHLRIGPVAGSQALALARRLGFPPALLARAEVLLGDEATRLRRTLAEAEALREQVREEQLAAATVRLELEAAQRRLEQEREELTATRREVARESNRRLESFRIQVRERLASEQERLEEQLRGGRRRGVVAEAVERLFEDAPTSTLEEPDQGAGPPVVGALVRHRGLGWRGRVERAEPGREVEVVVAGGMRLRVAPEDLVVLDPAAAGGTTTSAAARRPSGARPRSAPPPAASRRASRTLRSTTPDTESPVVASELMLIGRRVEESLDELDRFLDAALRSGEERVRVVHGHGTGRLRRSVRDFLRGHAAVVDVAAAGPDEGGDGATIAVLRR